MTKDNYNRSEGYYKEDYNHVLDKKQTTSVMKKTTLEVSIPQVKQPEADMPIEKELALLEKMIASFEAMNEAARYRNMRYFTDRFSKYSPIQSY